MTLNAGKDVRMGDPESRPGGGGGGNGPQKIQNRAMICPEYKNPEHFISYQRDACSSMLIAAIFATSRKRDQPRCQSIDEWIMRTWHV